METFHWKGALRKIAEAYYSPRVKTVIKIKTEDDWQPELAGIQKTMLKMLCAEAGDWQFTIHVWFSLKWQSCYCSSWVILRGFHWRDNPVIVVLAGGFTFKEQSVRAKLRQVRTEGFCWQPELAGTQKTLLKMLCAEAGDWHNAVQTENSHCFYCQPELAGTQKTMLKMLCAEAGDWQHAALTENSVFCWHSKLAGTQKTVLKMLCAEAGAGDWQDAVQTENCVFVTRR